MTAPFQIHVSLHSVALDNTLDNLIRSNDPNTKRLLNARVRSHLATAPTEFNFTVNAEELVTLAHTYAEQYVHDLCGDVDTYFAIANGRYFVPNRISSDLIVQYLFGKRKTFLPNTTAFSSAAEAIAGHCLEQFGYTALVRPLGVMPDLVFQTSRSGEAVLALVEAKHSIVHPPNWKIESEVAKFLLDVTTRAKLSTYRYEGYLITCQLRDQHFVECGCFHIDLERCRRPNVASRPPILSGPVPPYTQPAERLKSILKLIEETADANDRYLNELLSEEAKQTATLELIEGKRQ